MHKNVLRLASLLACVALATSRLGLIGHELVGHGGMALAFGAHIDQVQLFWFAGGWIRYHLAQPSTGAALAIAMAGIGLEATVGLTLWLAPLAARRRERRSMTRGPGDTLGRRIVRGVGAGLVVHGFWYLANGAWNGFGDGLVLYQLLGAWRMPVAIAAGLVTCAAGFIGGREVLGALAGTLPGSRRARVIGTVIAAVLGGGLHAALTAGELAVRRDPTYAATMQPERERVVERELVRWEQAQAQQGAPVTQEQKRVEQHRLEQVHREFPFVVLLAIATVLSILVGAWRAKPPPREAQISNRLLALTAAIAITSTWIVIVIDSVV